MIRVHTKECATTVRLNRDGGTADCTCGAKYNEGPPTMADAENRDQGAAMACENPCHGCAGCHLAADTFGEAARPEDDGS